jgi:hypothetical protein
MADLVQQRLVAFGSDGDVAHRVHVHPHIAGVVARAALIGQPAHALGRCLLADAKAHLTGVVAAFGDLGEAQVRELRGAGQNVAHQLLLGGVEGAKAGRPRTAGRCGGGEAVAHGHRTAWRCSSVPAQAAARRDRLLGHVLRGDEVRQSVTRVGAASGDQVEVLHVGHGVRDLRVVSDRDRGAQSIDRDADVQFIQPCRPPGAAARGVGWNLAHVEAVVACASV